ncbi:MAG: NADH-quinone oxidoreductase subunit NuoI [Nitrospira sp.]|nr:NADH-quinone oxidoreductase subunit NuoI [Candidatus Manganitrophaceae bacterium]HIL35112.1 NADH-quinone oxidoreductase subunit NuoI [Candidatus Manganitrophaceae bacterium]
MTFSALIDKVFFMEIVKALKLTFKHTFRPVVTVPYPHEKLTLPDTHRGALCLLKYEDGTERCVGCDLCEAACPSHCIKVVSAEDQDGNVLRRYATDFDIDITKCVFCGFCVEACPVNALGMTKMFEYSTPDKRTLLFDKDRLYEIGEKNYVEAKNYLVAHNQEDHDDVSREYEYRFPSYVTPDPEQD